MRGALIGDSFYATADLAEELSARSGPRAWPIVVCEDWEIAELEGKGYAGMCLQSPNPKIRQAGQAFMALPAAERLTRIRTAAKATTLSEARRRQSEFWQNKQSELFSS
jgi:hypothetical protein